MKLASFKTSIKDKYICFSLSPNAAKMQDSIPWSHTPMRGWVYIWSQNKSGARSGIAIYLLTHLRLDKLYHLPTSNDVTRSDS